MPFLTTSWCIKLLMSLSCYGNKTKQNLAVGAWSSLARPGFCKMLEAAAVMR